MTDRGFHFISTAIKKTKQKKTTTNKRGDKKQYKLVRELPKGHL